jgi:hypothetical protein
VEGRGAIKMYSTVGNLAIVQRSAVRKTIGRLEEALGRQVIGKAVFKAVRIDLESLASRLRIGGCAYGATRVA